MIEVLNDDIAILQDSFDRESSLARTFDCDVGLGGETLLLLSAIVLVIEFLAISWCDAIFGSDANVSVLCPSLVDGSLGIGSAGLSIQLVGFTICIFAELVLLRLVVV